MAMAERVQSALGQGFSIDEIESVLGNPGVVGKIKSAFDQGFEATEVDQLLSKMSDPENRNYSSAPIGGQDAERYGYITPEYEKAVADYAKTIKPQAQTPEVVSADTVGNVVRNLPFAPALPNGFIADAAKGISGFINKGAENVAGVERALFPRDSSGNVVSRTAQEASDMPEQFDANANAALHKVVNETVKPIVYPAAMLGVPGAGAIAAPLFLTDITRTLREKTQEATKEGYSNNITDVAMTALGKTDNALAQGVMGTVAEFTPFWNMGKEIAKDPATWVANAKEQPASTMYDIGMNALMVYLMGKGLVTKAPKNMEEAKQIIEAEKPKWSIEDQALADSLGNKKHMLNPDMPEMRQTLADVLMKISEQKWDKAEAATPEYHPAIADRAKWFEENAPRAEAGKVDLITRQVLDENGLQPRYPNPTDAQVMGGINQARGRALFDRAEAGKVDIITRQLRELDPYQEWWYNNAEGVPTPRAEVARPQAEYAKPKQETYPEQATPGISDFVEYRDIIQQETGATSDAILFGLQQLKKQQIQETAKMLQNDIKRNGGVENVREFNPDGEKVGGYRVTYNPKWYRDYYAEHKKPPTKADLLRIAEEALENGIDLAFEKFPPSTKYEAINKTIDSIKASNGYADVVGAGLKVNPIEAAELMLRYHKGTGELYGGVYGFEKIAEKIKKIRALNALQGKLAILEKEKLVGEVREELRQKLYGPLQSVDTLRAEQAQSAIDGVSRFVDWQESLKRQKKSNVVNLPERESNIPLELEGQYEQFLRDEANRVNELGWTRDRVSAAIDKIQEKFSVNKITAERDFENVSETGNLYGGLAGFEAIARRMGFKGSVPPAPKGSVRAGISLASDAKESVLDRGAAAGRKLYTDVVDKYSPIQNEAIRFEKETGIKLSPEENPYDRAHVSHTSSARAEMMIKGSSPEDIAALKQHYALPNDVTLKKVVNELPKGKLPQHLAAEGFTNYEDAFGAYLVARRQIELQANDSKYIGPIDSAKAMDFVNNNSATFQKAAESFYKYNDNLLQIAVDNGFVTPELAAVLRDKYKNYAAMSRDFSDVSAMDSFFGAGRGVVNVQGVLKRIKEGSERAVVNPLESASKNTHVLLSKVERNRAGQALANLADVSGGDYFAKKTTESPDPNKSIFSVFEKGEKVNYQTTPELYRALTAMNEEGVSSIVKILSYPTGWLRAGATLDPGFFVKNVTRDAGTAAIYSKYGFVPLYDTVRGMADIIGNKKLYAEYRASGAQLSVLTGMDRQSMSKAISSLNGKELWTNYNPVEILRNITGFFEDATRIREFQKAQEAGEGVVGQTRAAQEVTLNFTQKGAKGTAPNQLNAFLNAQIQGVAKMIQEHKNNPARTAGRAALYITAPSIGLWLMNHDDVRYQELPAYQRDLFWIVPTGKKLTKERFDSLIKSGKTKQQILDEAGALIRIPKPFELGMVYGSLVERFLDYAVTKDPAGMKRWKSSALTALTPNLIPTIAAPIIENITNHSFFTDRPIVPRRKENMPPKLQYTERTSELAKGLGNKAEAITPGGISPAKIDNAISGFFGGLGKSVVDTAEVAAQLRNGKTSKLMTEQPVFRAFFITPFRGSESVQTFYEKLHIQSQYKEAYDKTKTKDPNFDPRLYLQLENANKAIKELNKKAREIDESSQPADKKRKALDNINLSVLAISRNALKK